MAKEKEKKNLDDFLAEIGRAPLLSAEEELAMIKAIQEKGSECEEMEKLIESNECQNTTDSTD
jgi:DNA-directed RNA polymerase sigma subunit (sigma70/sigma32)